MSDIFVNSMHIGALSGATRLLFQAPDSANGGGMSILSAHILSGTTTSSVMLKKYSSAATPVLNGTIAAAVGGTASAFVADTPKDFTIATPFVNAGEWVAVTEGSVQACDSAATIVFVCQLGR